MALTKLQGQEMDAVFVSLNVAIGRFKKAMKDITPRVKALHEAGFHIEALMVNAQIVEHALKSLIQFLEAKRLIYRILEVEDPYERVPIPAPAKYEKYELGKLIDLLDRLKQTPDLVKRLRYFKDKFRNIYTHHVFDGSHDVAEEDRNAAKYLSSKEFNVNLVTQIIAAQIRLQNEVNELIQENSR